MTRLDDLPPDQRAVLLLLVRQGKSHGEIAEMLGIPERAVRDRAQAGLDALAGESGSAPGPTRAVQAAARGAQEVREPRGQREVHGPQEPRGQREPSHRPPGPRGSRRAATTPRTPAASRRAGALLLAAIVVVVVVLVVVLTGGGSNKSASGGATATSTAGQPHIDKQLNLTSPDPASNAVGIAEILSQGSQYAFYVAAEHLPPTSGFFYAAWLYNSSSDARVLGRAPSVSSNGRLQAVGALPANAAHYHQLLITKETVTRPTHPGPIVLSGPFSLH
jgi:hypothetical protein